MIQIWYNSNLISGFRRYGILIPIKKQNKNKNKKLLALVKVCRIQETTKTKYRKYCQLLLGILESKIRPNFIQSKSGKCQPELNTSKPLSSSNSSQTSKAENLRLKLKALNFWEYTFFLRLLCSYEQELPSLAAYPKCLKSFQ